MTRDEFVKEAGRRFIERREERAEFWNFSDLMAVGQRAKDVYNERLAA
jgi:hypothetical protein